MKKVIKTLSSKTKSLWAKKRTTDGAQLWLPLVAHLEDTLRVSNYLLNYWLDDGQIKVLTQNFDAVELQKLVKFLAFTHDIGKATPAFQTKKSFDGGQSLDEELLEKLVRSGFSGMETLKLTSPNKSLHATAGEAILESFGVPDSVSCLVGGHHGKPLDNVPRDQIKDFTANYWQSDNKQTENDQAIQQRWQQVQREIFELGLHESGYESVKSIPTITQPQAVLLEGLLIMSDWLSSSEYLEKTKQPLFTLIPLDQSLESINFEVRFESAMNAWTSTDEWEPQRLTTNVDPYKERWGFKARPVQAKITETIAKTVDPGIVIVEAGMGIGKTEIALVAAEQLAQKTGHRGIYFGLPTQATSNAMFDRVNYWVKFLAERQHAHFSMELMHGKRQFNDHFQSLPRAEAIDPDEQNKESVVVNSWFSGKKTILDEFTIGTIDNLLLMALKQKHLALRHLGLSKKVVIIDEAHAYDAYMDGYLYRAIEWLGAYGVPVVILSATLPKDKRNDLLGAYYHGKYGRDLMKSADKSQVATGWEQTDAYPLLTLLDGKRLQQITDFPGTSDQKSVVLQVERRNPEDEALIADILSSISAGGVAGVIVNTVKRAQQLARLVPAGVKMMVLHSAYLAPERTKREQELQDAIGKDGQRPRKMIVIGTQVLEQSLDIDFDILYTDIAPMDLLLQRAGRMHRHHLEDRPAKLQKPVMAVTGIASYGDYGDANESIYEKYLLMKTDWCLRKHHDQIKLPDDISHLVQEVYDVDNATSNQQIDDAKSVFEDDLQSETKKASAFQIAKPTISRRKTLHGWLDKAQQSVDWGEQQANAAVRDIQESIEVILVQHTDAGNHLIDGRKLSDCDHIEIAKQLVRLPAAVCRPISDTIAHLEKQTARLFPDWQNSVWLHGELVLPLDGEYSCTLNKWQLTYSSKYGLSYQKGEENG